MAELWLLKSISGLRRERQEMRMQMFLSKKYQSRKRIFQAIDEELDMAESRRKEVQMNKGVPRGGEMATEIGTTVRSRYVCGQSKV